MSERTVRRLAAKAGYQLVKSRRPEGLDNLGGYMIVDAEQNAVVAGARFQLDLDDVAAWLAEEPKP